VAQVVELCHRLLDATVIVVDNSEAPYLKGDDLPEGVSLITIGYNSGIAHAQNVGVAAGLRAGAKVLVFLDQDSKIGSGYLNRLVSGMAFAKPEIVAPLYVDNHTNIALPSVRVGRCGLPTAVHGVASSERYSVDIVISSGIAVTREVFELAGGFEDGLFIDLVDVEWCLRCRSVQIPIYVVPTALMRHSIGIRYFKVGTLRILVHSADRCYYQIRNGFLLLRKRHVPVIFCLHQIASILISRLLLLLRVENRSDYLKAYFFGVRDGLKGVTGAKPS
jgi:rhamnosyltransferase